MSAREFEYRLTWQREGLRRKSRRFATEGAAVRHRARLIDGDKDPHWNCDEGHGYGVDAAGDPYYGCMPPIIDGPYMDRRRIGEWEPVA